MVSIRALTIILNVQKDNNDSGVVMKNFIAMFLMLMMTPVLASQRAITDTGDEVILKNDGTWTYSSQAPKKSGKIKTNKTIFKKPKASGFQLKSKKNNSAFWINPAKWSFKKAVSNTEAEYEFQLKGKDLYGMAVTEEIQIALESLVDLALTNAQSAAPDARITKKEYRKVNGKKVIYMEIQGTIQSIKFTYMGYYYSNESGSTQLITYTATNLVPKYKRDVNDFLNGLIEQ